MGFEGNFKTWIMSFSVGWDLKGILKSWIMFLSVRGDLKGILSSGLYPIVSGGI